jgi:hypothetical protein
MPRLSCNLPKTTGESRSIAAWKWQLVAVVLTLVAVACAGDELPETIPSATAAPQPSPTVDGQRKWDWSEG